MAFALRQGSAAQRREAVLAEMGLPTMDKRRVSTLSGGEAQRVALVRALANPGRLLLLDEPFGNVARQARIRAGDAGDWARVFLASGASAEMPSL